MFTAQHKHTATHFHNSLLPTLLHSCHYSLLYGKRCMTDLSLILIKLDDLIGATETSILTYRSY